MKNQKLEDIKLLIKNDRRIVAVAGFIIIVLLIVTLTGKDTKRRGRIIMEEGKKEQQMTYNEGYRDLMLAYRKDIETLARSAKQQQEVVNRVSNELTQHKQRAAGIFETLVDRVEDMSTEIDRLAEQLSAQPQVTVSEAESIDGVEATSNGMSSFGFQTTDLPPPPVEPKPIRASVISPGDVVPVKLLTGVNAPVDGTPYPVVFKLNGSITGPDGSALDVGNARLIAAAQGSEADGRVLFRLQELSLRHTDGRRSVVQVDGWIVGEDGIRGMKGKLIDKLGRLILATMGVSFTAALGGRIDDKAAGLDIEDSEGVTILSEDLEFAYSSALTDASNRLGQILLDRYEKLVPVVEVLSGREVAAIFSQTAEIEIIADDDLDDGLSSLS